MLERQHPVLGDFTSLLLSQDWWESLGLGPCDRIWWLDCVWAKPHAGLIPWGHSWAVPSLMWEETPTIF